MPLRSNKPVLLAALVRARAAAPDVPRPAAAPAAAAPAAAERAKDVSRSIGAFQPGMGVDASQTAYINASSPSSHAEPISIWQSGHCRKIE